VPLEQTKGSLISTQKYEKVRPTDADITDAKDTQQHTAVLYSK